jgi:hypothetical protein
MWLRAVSSLMCSSSAISLVERPALEQRQASE